MAAIVAYTNSVVPVGCHVPVGERDADRVVTDQRDADSFTAARDAPDIRPGRSAFIVDMDADLTRLNVLRVHGGYTALIDIDGNAAAVFAGFDIAKGSRHETFIGRDEFVGKPVQNTVLIMRIPVCCGDFVGLNAGHRAVRLDMDSGICRYIPRYQRHRGGGRRVGDGCCRHRVPLAVFRFRIDGDRGNVRDRNSAASGGCVFCLDPYAERVFLGRCNLADDSACRRAVRSFNIHAFILGVDFIHGKDSHLRAVSVRKDVNAVLSRVHRSAGIHLHGRAAFGRYGDPGPFCGYGACFDIRLRSSGGFDINAVAGLCAFHGFRRHDHGALVRGRDGQSIFPRCDEPVHLNR